MFGDRVMRFAVIGAGLIAISAGAFAYAHSQKHGWGREARAERMFERLDANRDGRVTRTEMRDGVAARSDRRALRFDRADVDGDGFVTAVEMMEAAQERMLRRMKRRGARMDADGDGKVSAAEFADARIARAERRFERIDRNEDGVISRAEMRAMRGRHGRGHRDHDHSEN